MTKNTGDLELERDESLCSSGSHISDRFLIGDSIIQEEERLVIENEKIAKEEELEFQFLEDAEKGFETEDDFIRRREAEIKEKRYKRLMHLLRNSEMYATILKNRIQQDEANARKKESSQTSQSSQEPASKKQRAQAAYKVGDVLSEKHIDENSEINKKKVEQETSDVEFFSKTRKTKLGFTVSYKQPLLVEGAAMKDYQLKGLEWMINLFMNGVNGILADEMGLGKTIQVISFICYLIEQDIQGPFLIVVPLSTVSNWMNEFKRFAPKVPIMLYHGTEGERKALYPKIFEMTKVGEHKCQKVVITSFQIPLRDKTVLTKINWYYLIIDEGHRIKNHNSLLSRTLKEFNTMGRLLLTGTPLQNNLSELWSLLNFVLPDVFNSLDVFESWFDIKELEENGASVMLEKFNIDIVNILQQILVPFLLRREKKDVNLHLPPKKEILIYCPMTQRQRELYQATLDRSIEFLIKPKEEFDPKEPLPKRRCFLNSPFGKSMNPTQPKTTEKESPKKDIETYATNVVLRNPQVQLRKIVNHPYLVQYPLKTGTEEYRIDEDIVKVSGKLLVLDAILPKLKRRGHKVVLFSYFKLVLDILEDYAMLRKYSYCRLDGGSKMVDRGEEIFKFMSDPGIFLFFVSIRAGGLGINLTAADTVIIFDSDWNPQVNLQSQDRCHRIGQTKPVLVYRLCTIGTIDERIIERGNAKRRLEKMILQKGKFSLDFKNSKNLNLMDLQELKLLLESTDHDAVINSNGSVFTNEELEALLDRSNMPKNPLSSSAKDKKVFKVLNYEN